MKMDYEDESNRVGIYTQTSIEATAIGEGFAPQGEKSPVVIDYNHQRRQTSEYSYGGGYMSTASASSDVSQFRQCAGESFGNSENPFKKDINFSDFQNLPGSGKKKSKKMGKKKNKKGAVPVIPQNNIPSSVKQFPKSEEFFGKRRWQLALGVLKSLGYASWEINAMFGNLDSMVREGKLENVDRPELPAEDEMPPRGKNALRSSSKTVKVVSKADLRLKIGDANKQDFGLTPEYRRTLIIQINVILLAENTKIKKGSRVAVDHFYNIKGKLLVVCKNKCTADLITFKLPELTRLCDGPKLELCPLGPLAKKTLTELLEEFPREEHELPFATTKQRTKPRETDIEPDLSRAVERKLRDDLRLTIGDANNPDFSISPEHRKTLMLEINLLMMNRSSRVVMQNSMFINHKLVVVCKNKCAVNLIEQNLSELSRRCEGAKFVLCPRFGTRKKIQICLPSSELSTRELLKIIAKQNVLMTDPWIITNRCNDGDKVILDVVVDPETYVRFFKDQDEMHFLLYRATLKEVT